MQAEGNNIIMRPSPQPIGWLIGASVLFHVLMLMVFNQGFSIQAEKKSEKVNKIRATLIFTPEMLAAELEPELQQSPVEEELPVPKDAPINEASEFLEKELVENQLPEKDTPVLIEKDDAFYEETFQEEAIQEMAELDNVDQKSPESPSAPFIENQSLPTVVSRDLAKQHLSRYSQQRNQQMAQDAARAYRQQRISPDFPAAQVDPFKTEEEKFQESVEVKADCSSTANKSVAMVASIFGGNIKCSKPPPFQDFIDKRLNKEQTQ